MPRYLLAHRHQPDECAVVFASWRGLESPLRHQSTIGSCQTGGHAIWWQVESTDPAMALEQLPRYVAERTVVSRIDEVEIP